MERAAFNATRDRLAPQLAKIVRLLDNPTPHNLLLAKSELSRLAQG